MTIKNQKSGFFAYVLAAILTVVCLCLYVSNVNAPYYQDMNVNVIYMLIGALAAIGVSIALSGSDKCALKLVCDAARVAAAALIIYAGVTFIGMRLESFGYIYGSNLEMGNEAAFAAGNQAIWAIIIFMVTWIVSLVAAFLPTGKKA